MIDANHSSLQSRGTYWVLYWTMYIISAAHLLRVISHQISLQTQNNVCMQMTSVSLFLVCICMHNTCLYHACVLHFEHACATLYMQLPFMMSHLHYLVSYCLQHSGCSFVHIHTHLVISFPAYALIFSLTIGLCFVAAVCSFIVCVYNKNKIKKYYRRWRYSTGQT